MCDGAPYIRAAIKKTFLQAEILFCKFHFWQAMIPKLNKKKIVPEILEVSKIPSKFEEYIELMVSDRKKEKKYLPSKILKYDIKILETLPNFKLYLKYLDLIKPFWKFFAIEFYDYFISTYVDQTKESLYQDGKTSFKKKCLEPTIS